jgi:dihydropteroate synthase
VSDKLYLRPLGLIWGEAASTAAAEGAALRIAGGPAACTAFEIIEGPPGKAKRRILPARDLAPSREPQIEALLARITAPRTPVAGIALDRPVIMGIVNVTPDSFSDGGDFAASESAVAHGRRLAAEGAAIVDIGGESTRPGARAIDAEEELRRILPVLGGLNGLGVPISVDTRKAAVMAAAVAAGAAIINDVAALGHDPDALVTAARLDVPVILMHAKGDPRNMQDNPVYEDVVLEVYDFLQTRIGAAETAGIARERLIVDPGLGFGKTLEHNLALISGAAIFHGLGVPLLVGISRKRTIGTITGESDPKRRLAGSIGAALAAAAQGVQMLRVHDVRETRQALDGWLAAVSGRWVRPARAS